MRILIVKPSSLGDVIHALPVLRLLKLHLPQSKIYWWLASHLVPLLENDPDLAGVFPFGRLHHVSLQQWPEILRSILALRKQRFDLVIDLQGLARSGIFAWLANGELCVGLDNDREGRREGARMFYDLLAPRAPPGTHAVDRYLAVLSLLGVPVHSRFEWLPQQKNVAEQVGLKWPVAEKEWVVLLPGARWDNKRWPAANFQELVSLIARQFPDVSFAFLGSRDDRPLAQEIGEVAPSR